MHMRIQQTLTFDTMMLKKLRCATIFTEVANDLID